MTTMLFIHGRRQEGLNPEVLRRNWTAGLNAGLTKAGASTVDPRSVVFPFYGNLLYAKKIQALEQRADLDLETARTSASHLPADPAVPKNVAVVESQILRSMQREAEDGEAVDQESVWEGLLRLPGARAALMTVARHTRVDEEIIENFLTDVAVYLKYARDDVLDVVNEAIPEIAGKILIVAHSLGSVVARDLLTKFPKLLDRTSAFVTVGSPLGLDGVYKNLLEPGTSHPGVNAWLSVYDPADFVALGHPIADKYGEPLEEIRVSNPFSEAHSIEHYLGVKEVAAWISARAR